MDESRMAYEKCHWCGGLKAIAQHYTVQRDGSHFYDGVVVVEPSEMDKRQLRNFKQALRRYNTHPCTCSENSERYY